MIRSYLRSVLLTTLNAVLYGVTFGRFLLLEGRMITGVLRNWGWHFEQRPPNFLQPQSEQELIDIIKAASKIRVIGSGHSFNEGIISEETVVSLDKYAGVISQDHEKKQLTIRAGMRVRDVVQALLERGWAFGALPSHDAQSIAGIISTDVHGTGRDWGHVSESIVKMKIIDGRGQVHECTPGDDLFKAAIGGIGAVGIISEVTIQAVERFNVIQQTSIVELDDVKKQFNRLLNDNYHVSLYLFPFTTLCQLNIWNPTLVRKSVLAPLREYLAIAADSLGVAWIGDLLAHTGLLPRTSRFVHNWKPGKNLVLESNSAFNRSIYPLHWELEFTVPLEDTFTACYDFISLYEELYPQGLPYTAFEVRFTPSGHNRTFLGAGRERASTWIDLVCLDTEGWEIYYEAAMHLIKEIKARPHLGKYCKSINRSYLQEVHGEKLDNFRQMMRIHDPDGKFVNDLTQKLFEPVI